MDSATLAPPITPPAPRRGIPSVVLEIAGYAGAAAALAGVGVAFNGSRTAEAAIAAGSTAVLAAVGWFAAAWSDDLRRLRGVLWFLAVLSWVSVAAVLAGPDALDLHDKWLVVVAALITAALAVPLYVWNRRSLQAIAAFVSTLVVFAALAFTMTTRSFFGFEQSIPEVRWSALVTALFGVAGMALGGLGLLTPKRTAMVLGAIAFLLGAPLVFLNIGDSLIGSVTGGGPSVGTWTLVVTIVAALIVLVVGWRTDVLGVTGLGIVALLAGVSELIEAKVHATGPAIAVTVVGLAALAGVLWLARASGGEAATAPVAPVVPGPPPIPPAGDESP